MKLAGGKREDRRGDGDEKEWGERGELRKWERTEGGTVDLQCFCHQAGASRGEESKTEERRGGKEEGAVTHISS